MDLAWTIVAFGAVTIPAQSLDEPRSALADLFAQDVATRGMWPARSNARGTPTLVALVGHLRDNVEDVPDNEQWVCTGAGLMNFMNALHLLGFGAKVLSGASVRDESIRDAFCVPDESLVAWVLAGRPGTRARANCTDDIGAALAVWRARADD